MGAQEACSPHTFRIGNVRRAAAVSSYPLLLDARSTLATEASAPPKGSSCEEAARHKYFKKLVFYILLIVIMVVI
jgi:hypothetical protein